MLSEKLELEVTSNRLKSGAIDPREIMFEGVLAIINYLPKYITNMLILIVSFG